MPTSPHPFGAALRLLEEAVRAGVAPAAVAQVGRVSGPVWQTAVGALTYDTASPRATPATVFDLASLTKVVATTTVAMRLVDDGRLDLDAPVGRCVGAWRGRDRSSALIRDLLSHSSGVAAHRPLHERCVGRQACERAICELPLDYTPGSRSVYSDLGFILLGFILADAGGVGLGEAFEPIAGGCLAGGEDDVLQYGPLAAAGVPADVVSRTAPTQFDPWRGRLLWGEVDDRNAAALGGVAGHSGLFGTMGAVGAFARSVLAGLLGPAARSGGVARRETIEGFVRRTGVPGSSRALGWDTMLPGSSCGSLMSPEAFGHTGFTGTSLWIDPAAGAYAVLLTNRVHPGGGTAEGIAGLRRSFHDAVMIALRPA